MVAVSLKKKQPFDESLKNHSNWDEVFKLPNAEGEAVPINLDRKLAGLSAGVHRRDGQLLVILDIDGVLDLRAVAAAA